MTDAHTPQLHQDHTGHGPGHGPASEDDSGLAELLDLDAVLGAPVFDLALDAAAEALETQPDTVVDLGAGTGTGSLALARRFADARVHSLDASPAMLDRLRSAAVEAGLGDRIEPHLVDLDGEWPAVVSGTAVSGTVDLAWAALSLHHVTSPERVLQQVMNVLRPGGVLVVLEMTGSTTFEPDDLGTGNAHLAGRLVAALAARGYPVTGEWTDALRAADFSPVRRRDTALEASARTAEGAHYLKLNLSRHRDTLGHGDAIPPGAEGLATRSLGTDDLAALDRAIADVEAGSSRLQFASGRAIWVAVRP